MTGRSTLERQLYSIDIENKKNKFFVYPQINASIALVENIMIFYAGAEGTLQQNTYHNFVSENQFVSPTLFVAPTDKQFDVFGGLKGKVSNNLSYNVRGSVMSEKAKHCLSAMIITKLMMKKIKITNTETLLM